MEQAPKAMMIWSQHDGLAVTVESRESLLSDLETRVQQERGFSVATLNLDHVVKLKREDDFRMAYGAHTHVTADGNPIVWLSRLAGQRIDLVPGSELIDPICQIAARQDAPVGLLGSTEETLAAAAATLEGRHPGLRVVLRLAPAMGFDPNGAMADEAITQIEQSGARVVFLALGAPRQELFAARAQEKVPRVGFLSIGAGVDFIAGTQKRAPLWVRKLAIEWIWRLVGNPRRLGGRYLGCILVLPRLTLRALRIRLRGTEVSV